MKKYIAIFSSFTLISRFLGLARDVLIATVLGTSILSDMFFAAFRLPNLLRSVFAEGAFNGVFVPIFSELNRTDKQSALSFAYKMQNMLLMILILLVILAEVYMENILSIIAPGLITSIEKNIFIMIARIMMPYIIFIALTSLYCGILQTQESFYPTAICPIIMNLCIISALLVADITPQALLINLSYAVLLSGLLQVLLLSFLLVNRNITLKNSGHTTKDAVRKFFTRFIPAAFTAEVQQINILVDTFFASMIPNAISFIYYAERVIQLPIALIGISMNTVIVALASKKAHESSREELIILQNKAIEIALVLAIPATIGLILTCEYIVPALFSYNGKFDVYSSQNTSAVLKILAYALPAYILNKIFIAIFFALGNVKVPTIFSIISALLNILLNYFLVQKYSYSGIAMASCISGWFNAIGLLLYSRMTQIYKMSKRIQQILVLVFISSSSMIFILEIMLAFIDTRHLMMEIPVIRLIVVALLCLVGILVYFGTFFYSKRFIKLQSHSIY